MMLCSAVAFVEGYDPKIKLSQKQLLNMVHQIKPNEPLPKEIDGFDDTPIQIYMGFNEDSALSVDVDSAIYNLTFEIQAIYCPMCGRRL